MKQKIRTNGIETINELQSQINNGSKFIVYQYSISLFLAVTIRRYSPAILVSPRQNTSKLRFKYNLITLIFGWWGLPWGPIESIKSVTVNRKGGLDLTEDVMLNIQEGDLTSQSVEMKKTNNFFCKPDNWDLKSMKKALIRSFLRDQNVDKLVIGYYINTEENEKPFYTIGYKVKQEEEKYIDLFKTALYKEFREHTRFEFLDLTSSHELCGFLERQGETLINK